jgi:hypothetical protein
VKAAAVLKMPMLQCCNALLHMLQFKPRKGGMADRPQTVNRGHAVAPVHRPWPHRSGRKVLKDSTEPMLAPHSISFPSSSLCVRQGENMAAAIAASSAAAAARTHHRTTILQTSSLALSLLPLPHPSFRVLLWAAGEVTFSDPPWSPRVGPRRSPSPLLLG